MDTIIVAPQTASFMIGSRSAIPFVYAYLSIGSKLFPLLHNSYYITDGSCSQCNLKREQKTLYFSAWRLPQGFCPRLISRIHLHHCLFSLSIRPSKFCTVVFQKGHQCYYNNQYAQQQVPTPKTLHFLSSSP